MVSKNRWSFLHNNDQQDYQTLDNVFIFETNFWQELTKQNDSEAKLNLQYSNILQNFEHYYQGVQHLTSENGINLFDKNIIVIPIRENDHWYLCVGK